MLNSAVADRQDCGVLNQNDASGLRGWGFGGIRQKSGRRREKRQANNELCVGQRGRFHCTPPALVSRRPGLVPVKSVSNPGTLIDPFMIVPSNVPVKSTSVGEPSM